MQWQLPAAIGFFCLMFTGCSQSAKPETKITHITPAGTSGGRKPAVVQDTTHTQKKDSSTKNIKTTGAKSLTDSALQVKKVSLRPEDSLKLLKDSGTIANLTKNLRSAHDSIVQLTNSQNKYSGQLEEKYSLYLSLAIILFVLTAIALLFVYSKLLMMKNADSTRKELLDNAVKNTDGLLLYLIEKGNISHNDGITNDTALSDKIGLIKNDIENLVTRYLNEDQINKEKDKEILNLRENFKKVSAERDDLLKKLNTTVLPPSQTRTVTELQPATGTQFYRIDYLPEYTNSYIKSNVMVSAGPRKDAGNTDTELGEDVAGTLSLPAQTFFWLLDGTSDNAAIKSLQVKEGEETSQESHIFSSRLLAQNLGNYIQKNIVTCFTDGISLDRLLTNAKQEILSEWERTLNNDIPQQKKEEIIQMIRQGFKPLCSTTIVMGRLMIDGTLDVLRTGDSKVFPFYYDKSNNLVLSREFKFTKDPTDEYDRVAFRIDYNPPKDAFEIKSNIPAFSVQRAEQVTSVFAFSDGIGRVIENHLSTNNPGVVETIKQKIARIPQRTYDDKTLIILERILNPQ